jgi:hypothetical protein
MPEVTDNIISPWMPEQNRIRLAVLGKLVEECNELAARATRCIIQGIDERDPETERPNRAELEREIADVSACIETAVDMLHLNIDDRRLRGKVNGYRRWHDMIRAGMEEPL